jgi:hypothetical protein
METNIKHDHICTKYKYSVKVVHLSMSVGVNKNLDASTTRYTPGSLLRT